MLKLAKTSLLAVAVMATSVVASDILVTVNGKNVTKQDAQAFVSASAPQANFMELAPAEKKMVTDRLIEKVLFTELAAQQGIDKKPEFKRNMEKIKDELLVNMWMKTQMETNIVSDSGAKEFYEKIGFTVFAGGFEMNYLIMKNILKTFNVLAVVLLLASCSDDYLDVQPKGVFLSGNYYTNQEQAFAGLVAVYDVMRKNSGGFENMVTMMNAGSDDFYAGGGNSSDGAGIQAFSNYSINPIEIDWQSARHKMHGTPMDFEIMNVQFNVDASFNNWKLLFNWMTYISNGKDKMAEFHSNYAIDTSLNIIDNFSSSVLAVKFTGMWPTNLQEVSFSYKEGEVLLESGVTFVYDYFTIVENP